MSARPPLVGGSSAAGRAAAAATTTEGEREMIAAWLGTPPPPAAAAWSDRSSSSPQRCLRRRQQQPDVIDLLDDDDDYYYSHTDYATIEVGGGAASSSRPGGRKRRRRFEESSLSPQQQQPPDVPQRFKSDPNERQASPPPGVAQPSTTATDDDAVQVVATKAAPNPELAVLEVFPDADSAYIQGLFAKFGAYNVEGVITDMAENRYTKSKTPGASPWHAAAGDPLLTVVPTRSNKPAWRYDYQSTEAFTPTPQYRREATAQLARDFVWINKNTIEALLVKHKHHYAPVHHAIVMACRANATDPDEQYRSLSNILKGGPVGEGPTRRLQQVSGCQRVVLKRRRSTSSPSRRHVPTTVEDAVLREEVCYVREKLEEYLRAGREREQREEQKMAAQASNTAVTCACCCDGYPIEDMVACREEGHLFCRDCLEGYAKNQLFGVGNLGTDHRTKKPALELQCFHGDGCSSGFDRATLEKALPPKMLAKHDEIQFQFSIEAAGLANMVTCPKCNFQAELPAGQKILLCPVATCRFESCRECGEAAHIPLRCDEVEKESETKGRLKVEEAISEAKIRHCPKCKKPFLKSDGCNKITCGCGAKSCYVCRKQIQSYSHFCQKPHCQHKSCGMCPLYTKAEEDDIRAMREAGLQAAAVVREQSLKDAAASAKDGNGQPPQEGVNIDVESILKNP